MSVKDYSPERQAALAGIQKCRTFVEGEDAIKKGGVKYLLPFYPGQEKATYQLYLKEAQSVGVAAAMHQSLVGSLTRKSPIVTLPEEGKWILESFGDRSQGLYLWLAETLSKQVETSNDWIFIDYPVVDGEISIQNKEDQNIRPYPIHIRAEQILDSTSKMINAKETLVDFRYAVTYDEMDEDFKYETKTKVIRLYIDSDGNAQKADYEDEKVKTTTAFKRGGEPLKSLPVFPLSDLIEVKTPLLKAIVDIDCHIYNKQSRSNHYNYLLNTSTIVTSGVKDADQKELTDIGGIWHLGDDKAKAFTLGVDAEVVAASEKVINQDKASAASLGARMFADGKIQVESASALSIKNASIHATLGQLANVYTSVIERILEFTIAWDAGKDVVDGSVKIEMPKDYVPVMLNGQDLTALAHLREMNRITDEELFEALKRGEIIGDESSFEERMTKLQAQTATEPGNAPGDNPPL